MKIRTILKEMIVLLFVMGLITSTMSLATPVKETTPQPSDIGFTIVRGIITKPSLEHGGHYISFRCIFVKYTAHGIGEKLTGTLHLFQRLVLKNNFAGYVGDHFIIARFPGELHF
jgi:hypothetical protein